MGVKLKWSNDFDDLGSLILGNLHMAGFLCFHQVCFLYGVGYFPEKCEKKI